MKKWIMMMLAVTLAVCAAGIGFAAGDLEAFSVEYEEPLCLVRTSHVAVEVNGIEVEDDYLEIDTLVTNSSARKGYAVSVTRASVNGIEVYPTYSEDVDAEDECSELIEIDLSNVIGNADIHDISEIELAILIEDEDMEVVYKDVVHIYPYGEKKAQRYARPAAVTDIVVVDNEKYKVTVTGFEYVEDWGYSVLMYIQNRTDETIHVWGEDFSINDADAATRYEDYVGAQGVSFSRLEWAQSDLDEAEVEEVTDISFSLKIYDEEADNLLFGTTIALNP